MNVLLHKQLHEEKVKSEEESNLIHELQKEIENLNSAIESLTKIQANNHS